MSDFEPVVAFIAPPDGRSIYLLPDSASGVISGPGEPPLFFEPVEAKIVEEEYHPDAIPGEVFKEQEEEVSRPPDRAVNETAASRLDRELEERMAPFHEMADADRKIPWKERYEVIQRQFPSVEGLNWEKVFRADPTIMGNILNDIIKVEVAPKGRPGKRPALDKAQARAVLSQYRSEDYTLLPFNQAVNRLKKTNSVRQFARKVSMSPTYAYKLMMGYREPSVEDMELVAEAYGKHPSYFYEYRVGFVLSLMAERVEWSPESSIIYYERAMKAQRDA